MPSPKKWDAPQSALDHRYWGTADPLVQIYRALKLNNKKYYPSPIGLQCPKCKVTHRVTSRKMRANLGKSCPTCRKRWAVVTAPPPLPYINEAQPVPLEGFVGATWKERYAEYLKSPEWAARSKATKERDGNRCRVCNSPDRLQAHHRTYERVGREAEGDLVTLCDPCHDLFHKHRKLVH